jgi:hypothetical protein
MNQLANCPELNTLQIWAGYLSWLGFLKGLGAALIATGIIFLTHGFIKDFVLKAKYLLEILAYVVTFSLIAGGMFVSPEYLTWTVFLGSILFAPSVFLTIALHELKGANPKPLAALFMVVWGAIAIYYNLAEVGILSVLALMSLLGFSVVAGRLSYGFGWQDEAIIPKGTTAALLILAIFILQRIFLPAAPDFIQVFSTGEFWVGSIVAFTGLLILSNKGYCNEHNYFPMQIITVVLYLFGVGIGMILHINPLAGISGTFLVLYLAAKPLEFTQKTIAGYGAALIVSGGILFGMWWLAMQHLDVTKQYITTIL